MINEQDYIKAIRGKVSERIKKIEFIDKYNQVVGESTSDIIDGSISIQLNANARRNCSLTFLNHHGLYIPNEDSNIWIDRKFKLYTGYRVNSEEKYYPRGTFYVGNPTLDSNFSDKTVAINGLDLWSKLDGTLGGKLEDTYVIEVGERIDNAVRGIFSHAGETTLPIIYPTNQTLPYTLTKAAGDTYASILIELANMLSWEVFYDNEGIPRFQPPKDSQKEASVWDFGTGEVSYHGASRTIEIDKLRSVCKVYGDNHNGLLVTGIAIDNDIFSPTYVGKIGRKVEIIEDTLIYNTDLANQRAEYELKKLIAFQESVSVKCLPLDHILEGEVITIQDESLDLDRDRFQIQTITDSLRIDAQMSLGVWRERNLI